MFRGVCFELFICTTRLSWVWDFVHLDFSDCVMFADFVRGLGYACQLEVGHLLRG